MWCLMSNRIVVAQEIMRFEHLQREKGIDGDWYFHIIEDNSGYMWFGGHTGLTRYDGNRGKHFTNVQNNEFSLSENQVFRLIQLRNKDIWCSTLGGGLSILNPSTGKFKNLRYKTRDWPAANVGEIIEINDTLCYMISNDDYSKLWKIARNNDTFQFSEHPIEGESQNLFFKDPKVRYMFRDQIYPDKLWIIGHFRIYVFDILKEQLSIFKEFDFLLDRNLRVDLIPAADWMDGDHLMLYIAKTGIFRFSIRDGTLSFIHMEKEALPNHCRFIRRSKDGFFYWGFSDGRLYKYFPDTDEILKVYIQYPDNRKPNIEFIYETQNGDVYLATNGSGILKSQAAYHRVKSLRSYERLGPDYSHFFYNSYAITGSKQILYNSLRVDSIFLFDSESGLTSVINESNVAGICWGNFTSLDSKSVLVHNGRKLFEIDWQRKLCLPFPLEGIDTLTHSTRTIKYIERDTNGYLWIIGNSYLRKYSGSKLQSHLDYVTVNGNRLNDFTFYTIVPNGVFFVQKEEEFYFLSFETQTLTKLNHNLDSKEFTTYSFAPPSYCNGQLLVPCNFTGLWLANISGDSLLFYDVKRAPEFLLSNNVYGSFAQPPYVWISTGQGLQRWNTLTHKQVKIDYRHNLPTHYINGVLDIREDGSFSLPLDFYLHYGNMDLLIPKQIKVNAQLHTVWADSVPVISQWPTEERDSIVLKYHQNNLRFEWAILNSSPDYLYQIAYRLHGFDTDWKVLKSYDEFKVIYTNLSNGKYTFELKAIPNIDQDEFVVLSFPFLIEAAIWARWWFKLILVLLVLGIAYRIYKYRISVLRREEELIRQYNQNMNELKWASLRSQMNPHFMFNSLNSIKNFILKNESQTAAAYLTDFAFLIRSVLNFSNEKFIPLQMEINVLNTYISMEQLRFTRRFNYSLDISDDVDTQQVCVQPLIIQPFVENAIWHGLMQKPSDCSLIIKIYEEEGFLFVIVEDNGIGRVKSQTVKTSFKSNKSFGIEITKDRLYSLQSESEVLIEDLYDDAQQATGTRVILKLPKIHLNEI
jgi:hypothetical protein